jgi:hypothetical protein
MTGLKLTAGKRSKGCFLPVAALLVAACGTSSSGGSGVATSDGAGSTSIGGHATTGGNGFVLAAGGSSAGAGGSSATAGGSSASAGAGGANLAACEQCAAMKCADTLSACTAVVKCNEELDYYYRCLSDPFQTITIADCGSNLVAYAGPDPASALHACMTGAQPGGDGMGCTYTCLGNDSAAGGTGGTGGSCVRAAASDGQCASFMASAPVAWACPDLQTATQFQVAKSGCWSVNFIGAQGFCCPN